MLCVLPGIWRHWGLMCYFSCLTCSTHIPDLSFLFGTSVQFLSIWHMSRLKYRAPSWPSQSHRREQRVWNAGWDEEDASYLSCSQTTRSPGQRAPSVFRWTSSVLPSMVSAAMSVFPLSLSECLLAISSAGRKHVRNFQNSRTFFFFLISGSLCEGINVPWRFYYAHNSLKVNHGCI